MAAVLERAQGEAAAYDQEMQGEEQEKQVQEEVVGEHGEEQEKQVQEEEKQERVTRTG